MDVNLTCHQVNCPYFSIICNKTNFNPNKKEFYSGSYDSKLDIYTFGLTLVELFNGEHVLNNGRVEIQKNPDLFLRFISLCIDDDPSNRPTAKKCYDYLRLFLKCFNHLISKSIINYISYSTEKKNELFIKSFMIIDEKFKELFEF